MRNVTEIIQLCESYGRAHRLVAGELNKNRSKINVSNCTHGEYKNEEFLDKVLMCQTDVMVMLVSLSSAVHIGATKRVTVLRSR